jgi:hypothetical protein
MAVSKKLPPFDSKSVDPDTLEEASFAMGKSMKHKTPITPKTPKKVVMFFCCTICEFAPVPLPRKHAF